MKSNPQSHPETPLRRGYHWLRLHLVTLWLVAIPFLILFGSIRKWSEIKSVLSTLHGAEPHWLLIGIGLEALIMLSPVLTYRVILRRLGHVLPFHDLAGMHMQRIVVGTLAPISGPVSTFAFVRALNRRSVTTHDALAMLALRSVATNSAFVVLLLSAIAFRGPIYALCVAALVLIVVMVVVPLVRRAHLPTWIGPWRWRQRLPRSISTRLVEFVARFRRHKIKPSDLSRPLAITFSSRFGGILLLAVSLKAMGVDVAPKAIALVVMAELIAKVAVPIFHGIGVIEAATAIALKQSGVPAEAAVGAAIVWRAFEFWLPVTVALLSQAVVVVLARLPRPTLASAPLLLLEPQPVLIAAEAPALSRRRLGGRLLLLMCAPLLKRLPSGASEVS